MGVGGINQEEEDFLDQILSTIPNTTWPSNPNSNSNSNSNSNPIPNDLSSSPPDPFPFDNVYNNNNGFVSGSLHGNPNEFHSSPTFQSLGGLSSAAPPPASGSTGGSNGATPRKQSRVRARRGQATDPHSIAERLRRERIAERMKALQELVPNGNKTDKASMLDEIIDYVKFLQLQVKVVSMSRLGAAGRIGPLAADMPSEGGGVRRSQNGMPMTMAENNMTGTENKVAKLMEEDMGSAMQYLQGKGLCLMPISLASAISTATCNTRAPE